jgi:hypothetical protein
MTNDPGVPMRITASVVPDWRYALSSILGFLCVPFFAVAVLELLKVMEEKYGLQEQKLYKLFKIANWGGIIYFAFIHIGICMLPVVFNAGMEATGSLQASIGMVLRVLKSIAVPLGLGFVICDVFVTIGWIGLVVKGKLPVRKIALICNPVILSLLGQLMNYIAEGLDSGFESFGWLLMYLVCAFKLVDRTEKV